MISMMLFDAILHLDTQLLTWIQEYGVWIYAILFLIIFAETGLVVAPFLPGDSLLFVVGALCGMPNTGMELEIAAPLLMLAAFLGDNTNYWIGRLIGGKLINRPDSRFFKREYVDKTRAFYDKHGGKTILFARFLPIIRTFAPFVAGIAKMRYQIFLAFSAGGSLLWIGSLTLAGYFFGNIPFVKDNLTLIIVGIIVVSLTPAIRQLLRHRRQRREEAAEK
ncbi:MAG: DedA family protein [Gallionellaceae bacterium]|jgi:membrane-associated protein|nr:DedA family protein [Gallionellaceae bacterium]